MDKRLFSITCTTCQARLVIRSEAAIGAILECPRCASMVQAVPPPGWKPTPPPVQEPSAAEAAGPPPLDHVAEVPLGLDLEPPKTSSLGRLLGQKWFLWGVAPLAILSAILLLTRVLVFRPQPEAAAIETQGPAKAVAEAVANRPPKSAEPQAREVAKRAPADRPPASLAPEPPSPTVDRHVAADLPAGSPGPQPRIVAKRETAPPLPSTPSSRPGDVKPPERDPFSAVAEAAADAAAKHAGQIEVKKAPPAQVDVARRLADPIAQLDLTDIPLLKSIDLLAALSTLPITIDADAMTQLGVAPHDPVSLQLRSTTIGKALAAAVASKGLAVTTDNGQVFIGPPAEYREALRKVRYTVSDLTDDDKAAGAELAAVVRKLVAPESWQGSSGRGTIESDGGGLLVFQSDDVHRQVLVFCEKLRNARHKPLRSREDPEHFTLVTRWDQARGTLDRPVTANFHEPAPLAKILAFLAEASAADILIDRAALAAAETSDRVDGTLTAKQEALGPALAELLRPLGLAYRTFGPAVIQVTTAEAAAERLEIEFYPVAAWLAQGVSGPHLAERLKARVAASTWSDVGGPAEVYFDRPSQCLIVLQSQPDQVAIERLLAAGPQPKADEKK